MKTTNEGNILRQRTKYDAMLEHFAMLVTREGDVGSQLRMAAWHGNLNTVEAADILNSQSTGHTSGALLQAVELYMFLRGSRAGIRPRWINASITDADWQKLELNEGFRRAGDPQEWT